MMRFTPIILTAAALAARCRSPCMPKMPNPARQRRRRPKSPVPPIFPSPTTAGYATGAPMIATRSISWIRQRRWYKAELAFPAHDLPFTQFIGIDSDPGDRLDRFSAIYVRGQRYILLKSFEPIEGKPPPRKKKRQGRRESGLTDIHPDNNLTFYLGEYMLHRKDLPR